jgi:transcriptional regulator with XRE-family HTH domain
MNNFSQRLKELRQGKGLSLEALSAETDISYSALRQWESSMRVPNLNMVIILANFFGVTLDDMAGLTD